MYAKITVNHVRDMAALILTSQDEAILFHEPSSIDRYVNISATLGNATLFVCQMPLDRFTEWRNTERSNNVSLFEGRIDLIP